jgi:putative transposase
MGHFDYKRSYRRNLPHLQPAGATFFVTFRLAGSLPKSVVEQWQNEREWLEPS